METIEEDRTNPDMQYFWRSTNGTIKETITNKTLSKYIKEDIV